MCCVRRSSHQPADQYVAGEEARGETASGQAPRYSYTAFEFQDQLLSHCEYLSCHAHARKKQVLIISPPRVAESSSKPTNLWVIVGPIMSWLAEACTLLVLLRVLKWIFGLSLFEAAYQKFWNQKSRKAATTYQDATVGNIELDLGVVIGEVLSYPASRRCYYYSETWILGAWGSIARPHASARPSQEHRHTMCRRIWGRV
jgi:hypothetical protein